MAGGGGKLLTRDRGGSCVREIAPFAAQAKQDWIAGLRPGAYMRAAEQHAGSLGMTVTRVLKSGVRIGHVA
jgi:hypothetical protein